MHFTRNRAAIAVTALLSVGSSVALADGPKLSDLLATSGLTANGYVAASYFHSTETNAYHNYDIGHDSFQLDQAALTVAFQPKQGFGAVVNVIAGEDARLQNSFEDSSSRSSVDVLQAYAQYATGNWTIIGGKFVTLAGAEVIAPTGNTNFSRSLLFAYEPSVHTGVRATYAVSDKLSVIVGANNGWNYTKTNYGSKTGEFGISLTPSKAFALTAQTYIGKDPVFNASRKIVDLVGTFNATDALSFVLSYDWGRQDSPVDSAADAKWSGLAGYVNAKLNPQWRVSLRLEYLDDKDGFLTGAQQKLTEGTITLGYAPADSFELRLEGRYDKAPATTIASFSPLDSPFTDKQTELAVQGVYKF